MPDTTVAPGLGNVGRHGFERFSGSRARPCRGRRGPVRWSTRHPHLRRERPARARGRGRPGQRSPAARGTRAARAGPPPAPPLGARNRRRRPRAAGRRDGRVRLVSRPRDPPDRRPGARRRPDRGRRCRHREHPPGRLDRPLRPVRPERRLRTVFAGGERGQQRRGDDPPPQSGHPRPVDPLDSPRPVRPERPDHRGQQDRRRPLPGAQPAGGRHQRELRHPHPALRGAQFRHLRQRRRCPRRRQDVLPGAGLRRLLRAQGPHAGLHQPGRLPRPPGRPRPAPPVQGPGRDLHESGVLALRDAERPGPHPPRPRVPPRAGHGGVEERALESRSPTSS